MFKTLVTAAILVWQQLDGCCTVPRDDLQELGSALVEVFVSTSIQDDGKPYGDFTDEEFDAFTKFAKNAGFDFDEEFPRIYKGDEQALGRFFQLSLKFDRLDLNARMYGQCAYSNLLNFGEAYGVSKYAEILDRQPAEVRQRIRDFVYFPIAQLPPCERKRQDAEVRESYPTLCPASYRFGKGNPIFSPPPATVAD